MELGLVDSSRSRDREVRDGIHLVQVGLGWFGLVWFGLGCVGLGVVERSGYDRRISPVGCMGTCEGQGVEELMKKTATTYARILVVKIISRISVPVPVPVLAEGCLSLVE
jgi:hypothetical protein